MLKAGIALVWGAILVASTHQSVKNDALVYVESLASNYNQSADQSKLNVTALSQQLANEYALTKNLSYQQNLYNILSLNSRGYDLNCSENFFWALNGIKDTLDDTFDACAHYEDSQKTLTSFIEETISYIENNRVTVNQALSYVKNCTDDPTDVANCSEEGTLSFLSILEENRHYLEMYSIKGFYFESELSIAFSACITHVTHAATDDMSKFMLKYCEVREPTTTPNWNE